MNARELTKSLAGRWHGSHGMAPCPAHDDSTPSLAIRDGKGRCLIHCHAGCDQVAVIDALKDRGLWGKADHQIGLQDRGLSGGRYRAPDISRDDEARERIAAAKAIWDACEPADPAYLRTRGITIDIPKSIRFHPALKHSPTGLFMPAMVAAVQAPDRIICGIHRTYLTANRDRKAGVNSPKMTLGPLSSGAVRLAAPGEVLGLAEGIETGLSAMQLFNVPVWTALGSRLHSVALPACVKEVRIYADNGEAGELAAKKAVDVFTNRVSVVVQHPPPEFGDFNDLLMKRNAA